MYVFTGVVVVIKTKRHFESSRDNVVSSWGVDDGFSVDILHIGKVLWDELVSGEDNNGEDNDLVETLSENVLSHSLINKKGV